MFYIGVGGGNQTCITGPKQLKQFEDVGAKTGSHWLSEALSAFLVSPSFTERQNKF